MKLFRFGTVGYEKPGVELPNGRRLDVSSFGEDYQETFFATEGLTRLKKWLQHHQSNCPEVASEERLGSCIGRPSKIICVGLNYAQHAKESGMEIPKEPVIFFKSTTALCGPFDPLILPKNSKKTDWEVELAVVIGKKASYVALEEASQYIAGFTLHNDYSEREFQLERGGQWVKGKSCDSFAPLGPYLVTVEELPHYQRLPMWLRVNGELKQESTTEDMIFGVPFLIHYLSQFLTLLPGDVISTGTPAGVGLGFKPPQYLKRGDVVELGMEGLGMQRQLVICLNKSE